MHLTVGEISKVLGISTELIRFYVREGLIKPRQNQENSYWEYSSEDVMLLTDILFYRTMDISIKDIKQIFDGLDVKEIGKIIEAKKQEAFETVEKYTRILENVETWEDWYQKELELLGEFKIGNMPSEIRKEEYFDESDHIARYLKNGLNIEKEDLQHASYSFYCDIYAEEVTYKRYLSLNKTVQTAARNANNNVIEESAEKCIYTQVYYSENLQEMVAPLIEYAKENNYQLTGEIYGRENTNYYKEGKRYALYRIYAIIK